MSLFKFKKAMREDYPINQKYYKHPSPEEIDTIVVQARNAGLQGTDIKVDGEPIIIGFRFGQFFIWHTDAEIMLGDLSEDQFRDTILDIKGAIKKKEDELEKWTRDTLPKLWHIYKKIDKENWGEHDFSEIYKDVFGHRPRSDEQVVRECHMLADELGIKLETEEKKEEPLKHNEFGINTVLYYIFEDFAERGYHKTSEGPSSTANVVREKLKSGKLGDNSEINAKVAECVKKVEDYPEGDDFVDVFKKVINNSRISINKTDSRDFNTFCYIAAWFENQKKKDAQRAERQSQRDSELSAGLGAEFAADTGTRLTVKGTVKEIRNNNSLILEDDAKHLIQIFVNNKEDYSIGDKVTVTGTVQRNYEYGGQKYSYLNRIKINSISEAIFTLKEDKEEYDTDVIIPFISKSLWGKEFRCYTTESELQSLIDDPDKKWFTYTDDPELIVDGKITLGHSKSRDEISHFADRFAKERFAGLLKEDFDLYKVPGGGLQIGWIYSGDEDYEDTQYAESPKYDEQVIVKAGQKVPLTIYPSPSGIAYYAFDCVDGGKKTDSFYLYNLNKYIKSGEVELLPEFVALDNYPYIDRVKS